jgi:large subunit ribosomal protein L6
MSRVGKKPITLPDKTKAIYANEVLTVEGPKGRLVRQLHPGVQLTIEEKRIQVTPRQDDRNSRALQGLTRSLVANMVQGVANGFERILEINGIGYRANVDSGGIQLSLGYSHPIVYPLPPGVTASVEKNNVIRLACIDKELLGRTAAAIRRLRPPEPYKGKGVKFAEERIQRKAGKTGTK